MDFFILLLVKHTPSGVIATSNTLSTIEIGVLLKIETVYNN